ncbi:hypothetical protein GF407_19250 [candidate division KSB1 bacterium]|nr:hypothetical protein [candidate division KSB1 bacterium]
MIKRFIQNITLFYFNIIYGLLSKRQKVSIHNVLKQAENILVCLPDDQSGIQTTIRKIDRFRQVFPNADITLFNPTNRSLADRFESDFNLIESGKGILNFSQQINSKIKSEIFQQNYQVTIDLSRTFQYENILILCMSHADLRIGFDHPRKIKFYNFVIRISSEQTWDTCLDILTSFLKQNNHADQSQRL